jgi:hypothetical protein
MTRRQQVVLFLEKEGLALLSIGQPPGRLVLGEEVAMLTRKQRRMEAQLHDLTRPSSNA